MRIRFPLSSRHGLLFLLFVFLLSPSIRCIFAQQGKESLITNSSLGTQETEQTLTLFLLISHPSDEMDAAVESLGLCTRRLDGEKGRFVAVIRAGKQGTLELPGKLDPAESDEGYRVVHGPSGELCIASKTQHGLANGIYDVRRQLLVKGARLERPSQLLEQGDHAPHFGQRAFYHFMTTWGLERLTCDTLTAEQWRIHLQRMRSLNANQFYFDIWADQYYHPDYPETWANKVTYDRMRAVCDYAHKLGLRTGVYFFPCQVPPSVYLANPQARAVEAVSMWPTMPCSASAGIQRSIWTRP